MNKRWLGLLLLLSACTQQVAYDRSAGSAVQSIGLLTIGLVHGPTAWLIKDGNQLPGPIGAMTGAAAAGSRDAGLYEAVTRQGFNGRASLRGRVVTALKSQGFNVIDVPAANDRTEFMVGSYGQLPSPSPPDAFLDCFSRQWGYISFGVPKSLEYRPFISMNCRLVRAGNGEVLMRDQFSNYPKQRPPEGVNWIDPAHVFATVDELIGHPARAVAGLETAFDRVAAVLATSLK